MRFSVIKTDIRNNVNASGGNDLAVSVHKNVYMEIRSLTHLFFLYTNKASITILLK